MKLGDFQVIQDLTFFVIGDLFKRFCIYHNLIEYDQVRDIFADLYCLVANIKPWLLFEWDIP